MPWTKNPSYLYLATSDLSLPSSDLLAWVGNSIFLGGLKVQRHTLSWWFAHVEIDVRPLMSSGMLLSPQLQQERRQFRKDNPRPVDLRVTSRTESDHQMQYRLARLPMMG
ncbi:MAG TPA: hypothetical protein VK638_34270 [Edaphobacter sp.]|nr:hypothetical protein [Edaphobacter sp.]